MAVFLTIYLLILGVMAIGGLASYVLRGVGMYTIGKQRGMNSPWLAFIPYARTYFRGELCGSIKFRSRELKSPGIWLIVIPIAVNFVVGIFTAVVWSGVALNLMTGISMGNSYGSGLGYGQGLYGEWGGYHDGGLMNHSFSGTGITLILIAIVLLSVLSIVGGMLVNVLEVLVNRQIYARYTQENHAVVHAVAGIFLPLYTSIYFFLIRNREQGMYGQMPHMEEPNKTGSDE